MPTVFLPSFSSVNFYPSFCTSRFKWIAIYSTAALIGLIILLRSAYLLYKGTQKKNPPADQENTRVRALVKKALEDLSEIYLPSEIWVVDIFSKVCKPFVFSDLEGLPLRRTDESELKKQLVVLALVSKTFSRFVFCLEETPVLPPRWKTVTIGLNLMATCSTNTCEAFKQIVYIPMGLGTFDMMTVSSRATCPQCKNPFENLQKIKWCFWNCLYAGTGRKTDGLLFKEDYNIVFKNDFLEFNDTLIDPALRASTTPWAQLTLTTTKTDLL